MVCAAVAETGVARAECLLLFLQRAAGQYARAMGKSSEYAQNTMPARQAEARAGGEGDECQRNMCGVSVSPSTFSENVTL